MVGKGLPQRKIEAGARESRFGDRDAYCENDGVTVLKGLSLHVKEARL